MDCSLIVLECMLIVIKCYGKVRSSCDIQFNDEQQKRIHYLCKGGISKFIPPTTICHHSASLTMSMMVGKFFLSHPQTNDRFLLSHLGLPSMIFFVAGLLQGSTKNLLLQNFRD